VLPLVLLDDAVDQQAAAGVGAGAVVDLEVEVVVEVTAQPDVVVVGPAAQVEPGLVAGDVGGIDPPFPGEAGGEGIPRPWNRRE
jgi:hypothetical protein